MGQLRPPARTEPADLRDSEMDRVLHALAEPTVVPSCAGAGGLRQFLGQMWGPSQD